MIYPLLKWTQLEIWEFIKQYKLPLNPCYKTVGRVGCMFCPFSKAKEINMYEKKYPKVKETILKSLEIFIQHRKNNENRELNYATEYYEWWKSKKSVKEYKAKKKQLNLFEQ